MDYPLENLSPEKFQLFCQSLLAREFPNLQCMPVGQPDGGRDAIQWVPAGVKQGFVVFQVKFVRAGKANDTPHEFIEAVVRSEATKVSKLIPVGAKQYVLLTNAPGTAHLDTGSIDAVNGELSRGLGIPATCWWRNDICRRLDDAWSLKWVYPELMTGPDLIRAVIESGLSENRERRSAVLRAFLAHQFSVEQEVKFKQIELQNRLLDLFIDVPISPRGYTYTEYSSTRRGDLFYSDDPLFDQVEGFTHYSERSVGAATFLLKSDTQEQRPRLVLEGAPGQGKSTITQYICQVHRMRLLGKAEDLIQIPEGHRQGPLRLPLKVDLRDYAAWIERKNPFTAESELLASDAWTKTLESFLAALIGHLSGGARFDVSDLQAIARVSAVLLVLDGLDEVADIRRRGDVVEEIERGVARLESNSASLQVVVTSRPTAFANSPGLSEKKFTYVSLGSVTRELIDEYATKWLKARRMEDRESAEVKRILKEKLDQPHIRDLARNPMQLSILLSLIHTRGPSLPDRRTALYDAYMDLFFSREAEKSLIVREYRDVLIDIHRYLGWLLHTESEVESPGIVGHKHGALTSERLIQVLRTYLEGEGRDPNLAQTLFTGVAERVMALVSRVQGTYEFEVQPLREYFAGRFLFETAPYSPTGNERSGTRPDRFDAIARNFYWLNVTRFYAGCYSKGELTSLIDRLNDLARDKDFRLLSHPRTLAATLLADYVFSQHPRSVKDVLKLILDDLGLRFALVSSSRRLGRGEPLVLPKDCGKQNLIEHCFALLAGEPPVDFALDVIDLLKANGAASELLPIWKGATQARSGASRLSWLFFGVQLGCLSLLDDSELRELFGDTALKPEGMDLLFKARKFEFLQSCEDTFAAAVKYTVDRRIRVAATWRQQHLIDLVGHLLDVQRYAVAFSAPENTPLSSLWKRRSERAFSELNLVSTDANSSTADICKDLTSAISELVQKDANVWARNLGPWEALVEALRTRFGSCWCAVTLATVAAGIKSTAETCTDANILFDEAAPLCRRARYARLRAGAPQWWAQQSLEANLDAQKMFFALSLFTWASQATLRQNIESADAFVSPLSDSDWQRLFDSVEEAIDLTKTQSGDRHVEIDTTAYPENLSSRTWALLFLRAKRPQCIYECKLRNYDGPDLRILKLLQDSAVRALTHGESNRTHSTMQIAIIERAFARGVISEPYMAQRFSRSHRSRMPDAVAINIAENAIRYPGFLVAAAELACRRLTSGKLRPVATVAENENWFRR